MPYIPRSMSPTSLNPEGIPRAPKREAQTRPPVPYLGSNPSDPNPLDKLTKKPASTMMSSLNMLNWDVAPAKIYKMLTNKELTIDEHSRLVSNSGQPTGT